MKKILPIILLLIGTGAGVGAGIFLRPAPDTHVEGAATTASPEQKPQADDKNASDVEGENVENRIEYVKMSNQFVIPVVNDAQVTSLVVLALSIEVPAGKEDTVRSREPKLRDSFLRVLFDHANIGGFDGAFTEARNLATIRRALTEIAQKNLGEDMVKDVLISDIARQDY